MRERLLRIKDGCMAALVCALLLLAEMPALAAERSFFAMDTYITMSADGGRAEEALDAAEAEVKRLEALFSTELADSDIARLNREGEAGLSPETFELLTRAKELWGRTGGAFNSAIYPLMQAWGFPTGNFRVPEEEELQELLKLADPGRLFLQENADKTGGSASLELPGMAVDLGGIAKGYVSSRLVELFRQHGLTGGLVNLGGNVQVLGKKPDGSRWRIGIEDPKKQGEYLGILETADRAVITSGGYERYFEEGGIRYHHILDPSTGRPAESGVVSATVVSPDGTLADALSTALFVMGKDAAAEFWQDSPEEFEMILLDGEGVLWITEGLEDCFLPERESRLLKRQ